MKKNICIHLLCLLAFVNIYSQMNISGKIVNGDTNALIPYASIGIKNTDKGSISNEKGEFKLSVSDKESGYEMIISAIGFEEKSIRLQDLNTDFQTIKLKPIITPLDEVVIVQPNFKHQIVGKKSRPYLTFVQPFSDDNPAVEQGSIINIPKYAVLKNYNFHTVPASRFKEVKLKLNIYGIKNQQPDKQLLTQNVIFTVTKTGWHKVDLKPFNIKIKGYDQIAVTCQLLSVKKLDTVPFSFGFSACFSSKKRLLIRNRSQSDWQLKNGILLANCEIDYKKDKSNADENSSEEESTDQNIIPGQTAQDLISIYKHKKEAKESGFGSNKKAGGIVNSKEAKLYYETYGNGQPLVLLHGNGGEIADFYKQIPVLSKKYKVIAIDTRGQGKSEDFSKGNLSYELFADDVKTVLDSLHLKKANILGWSDGGNTALILAYTYPEYVDKLVTMGAVMNPEGVSKNTLTRLQEEVRNEETKSEKDNQHLRLARLLVEQPNMSIQNLNTITSSTLIIAGERDIVKLEHSRLISESISNSELKIIKGASHYLPQEKPKIVNRILLDFYGSR